jgi:HD-GYP domain-containing protein (c-di-GMP phosphodiesterase class II)
MGRVDKRFVHPDTTIIYSRSLGELLMSLIRFDSPADDDLSQMKKQAELVEELLAIGTALSSVQDLDELLNLILAKSREITLSDAGSVYLIDRSEGLPKLLFKVAHNDSQPKASFREFAMPLTHSSLAGYVALTGKSLNLPDAYCLPPDVPYQFNHSFDSGFTYRTRSVLVLPMQNQARETIGVLQLINRKVQAKGDVTPWNVLDMTQPYSDWEERIVRSLASQAAVSIERNHLQESIENLFEGFVRASVQAIESRDPCTSGHSERVAALTVRLCEEVNAVTQGRLRSHHFNPHQLQEVRYASLLHDFGKVGVPEAVLVKEKKLYAHQLEILRYRFALARRTLEMECAQLKYRYLIEHPAAKTEEHEPDCPHCQRFHALDRDLETAITNLDHYWSVLESANEPQVLEAQPLAQLQALATLTYRDIDGESRPIVTPEEIQQLTIPRGTLTAEERLAIQSHVTYTYEFLRHIPWTRTLENVPDIAVGHHEKLDGSGYPHKLRGDGIPIQSQLMTIADIYDALTAADRPYKRSLAPTVAIKILHKEADEGKIAPDLVELFEHRHVFQVLGHSL